MKAGPVISIVVLNYNTSDLLNGALESIRATAGDLSYDVTVIDNNSTDGGFERVKDEFMNDHRFSFIQMEKNVGWVAINIMLERTAGGYIVTVDPDAILHPNTLQTLFAFMEKNPEAGAATASLLNPDGSSQLYYRRIMTPTFYFFTTVFGRVIDKYLFGLRYWKQYRYADLNLNQISEVEQPAWPCFMWRREALGAYIVDRKLPFYFLDVEMSKRLYARGYKIFLVPQATITHLKSTSYGKRSDEWRWHEYYRSLMVYFWKHYPFYAPLMWILSQLDRLARDLIKYVTGREPLH